MANIFSKGGIKGVKEFLKDDLKSFNKEFKDCLKSDVKLINKVVEYIAKNKGKRLRPILVFLSSKICGEVNRNTLRAAAIVELLHTATLVHDDVVDKSDTRHGVPSINSLWDNKISVLIGDYMFAQSLINSLDIHNFEVFDILSVAAKRIVQGEINQIDMNKNQSLDENEYYKMVGHKTAALFTACCELGAVTTGINGDKRKALAECGENAGIAFQIRDDVLDIIGKESLLGKPKGNDIKNNGITLPLIYSINNAPKTEAGKILKMIKAGPSKDEVETIVNFVKNTGGFEYTDKSLEKYLNRAKNALDIFEDSPAKAAFITFLDYNARRVK